MLKRFLAFMLMLMLFAINILFEWLKKKLTKGGM